MRISFALILVFLTCSIWSQAKLEGFYVSIVGDTIYGHIIADIDAGNRNVQFQKLNGEMTTLTPLDTKVIVGPVFGKLSSVIKEGVFVNTIMEGKIDMHRYEDTLIMIKNNNQYTIILTEKHPVLTNVGIGRAQQLGILKLLTYDEESVSYVPQLVKFNYDNIYSIFEAYNKAADQLAVNYGYLYKRVVFSYGVLTGLGLTGAFYPVTKSPITLSDPFEFGRFLSLDKNIGISFRFRNIGRYHKLAYNISPFLSFQKLISHLKYDSEYYNNLVDSEIRIKALNIPISLNYALHSSEHAYLYLNTGFNLKFNFRKSFISNFTRNYKTVAGFPPSVGQTNKTEDLPLTQVAPSVGLSYLRFYNPWEIEYALNYQLVSQYFMEVPKGSSHNIGLSVFLRRSKLKAAK